MKSRQVHGNIKSVLLISLAIASLICSVSACVTAPTQEQAANADYGPSPDNYKEIIASYMESQLFEPHSAVYSNWSGPVKGYSGGGSTQTQTAYGYRVCVDINVKNTTGGYVGEKRHYFVINNGRVVQYADESSARQMCDF